MSFIENKESKGSLSYSRRFFNRIVDHVYAVDGVDLMIEREKLTVL